MNRRSIRMVGAVVLSGVLVLGLAPAAYAACHRFDLEVSTASPAEGDSVTVTVSRDGSVGDSSVRVSTAGGSAQPGADFAPLDRTIEFTGDELQQSATIDIVEDGAAEPEESFTVGLSDPGGCAVNPNFVLADEVTLTIAASEGAGEAEEPPADIQSPAGTQPTETPAEAEESPPGTSPDEDEDDVDDDGFPAGLILVAVLVIVAAGGYVAYKRRGAGGD